MQHLGDVSGSECVQHLQVNVYHGRVSLSPFGGGSVTTWEVVWQQVAGALCCDPVIRPSVTTPQKLP